uniref:Uncharacterized protein n=1 Tax=Solanum lycopersicum TaxID=4081 RepID=A0A3Q7HL79_SOLLC
PNNREKNRATTNHINEQKHLFPCYPFISIRSIFINHNLSYVCYNL